MALHESLRELVSVRGEGVVDEAEELRGALDDFLAEDEATLGELNLLVDAVRLGALRRVLEVLAHGAQPQAAIREAGAALARDRGTDDPSRSCWALAVLCFALGKVDESLVKMFRSDAGTVPAATPPSAPHGPVPDVLKAGTVDRPRTVAPAEPPGASSGVPPVTPSPPSPPPPTTAIDVPPPYEPSSGSVPPVVPEERRSGRAGVVLLVLLVALILGGLVAAGVILLRDDDKGGSAASDPPTGRGGSSNGSKKKPGVLPDSAMLVPYLVDGVSTIYEIDLDGDRKQISPPGLDARLPTISPDRRTMTFQDFTDLPEGQSGVLMRMDLATGSYEPFFKDSAECTHTVRPGWSLDGSRVAVICTGDDDVPEGIFVGPADGSAAPTMVYEGSMLRGSPTWTSDSEFVFGSYGATADAPLELYLLDADLGGDPVQVPIPDDGQISHADWSEEAGKLLFLVSPLGGKEERGDIWTMNANGTGQKLLAAGGYSHPVWDVDGTEIGMTLIDDTDTEVLGYLDVADPTTPHVVEDPPPGEVGIPVWGSR